MDVITTSKSFDRENARSMELCDITKKLGRNPRSDRDLCEKGNKSQKRNKSVKKEIKVKNKIQNESKTARWDFFKFSKQSSNLFKG